MSQEKRKIIDTPPPRLLLVSHLQRGRGSFRCCPAHLDADTVTVAPRPQLLGVHGGGARQQEEGQVEPWATQFAEIARIRGPGGLAGGGAAAAVHVQEGGEAGLPSAPGGGGLSHLVFEFSFAFTLTFASGRKKQ